MLKKICVIYRRGDTESAVKILAPDDKTARRIFLSNKHDYAGCGTEILKTEEYDRVKHDGLLMNTRKRAIV